MQNLYTPIKFAVYLRILTDSSKIRPYHRVPNPQTVRDIEEDFIMGVTYIIAIVAAVVLLALNLIRDYGKKG